jgi:hypothetical protein
LQLRDLTALRHFAQLVARKLELHHQQGYAVPPDWSLVPKDKL